MIVKESIEFKRGQDPKRALGIGAWSLPALRCTPKEIVKFLNPYFPGFPTFKFMGLESEISLSTRRIYSNGNVLLVIVYEKGDHGMYLAFYKIKKHIEDSRYFTIIKNKKNKEFKVSIIRNDFYNADKTLRELISEISEKIKLKKV